MRLEPVQAEHTGEMAALHARTFAAPWTVADLTELLASPGVFGLIARDDEPVGFILARAIAGEAEILTLAVDPAARRLGIGRALVAAVAGLAIATGAEALFLEVDASNLAALALYLGAGFAQVGRRPGYYAGGADALVLRRALNTRGAGAYVAP